MSGISTHILDTALGRPASAVPVILERADGHHWLTCASTTSGPDGCCPELLAADKVLAGRYRITFATASYFASLHQPTLYPEISITFNVAADHAPCHLPLLLNASGYTTYRGS